MTFEAFFYKIRKRENPFYSKMKDILTAVAYFDFAPPKFLFRPLYELLVAWRFLFPLLIEKIVYVPIFKSRCETCGRGMSLTNGIPWIEGHMKIHIGDNVMLDGNVFTSGFRNREPVLKIGNRTHIGYKTTINVGQYVEIGADCLIAGGCSIQDNDGHPVSPYRRLNRDAPRLDEIKPVVIEDNVWIGVGSFILKGVRIGEGSVVAANSLVTKSVPPYSIVVGVPAKIVISGIDRVYQEGDQQNEH